MGKTVNQFVAEPFTNSVGQTISPGDRVAYVSHGYRISTGKGVFAGVFKDSQGTVVSTRVSNIRDTKSVNTGKKITSTYTVYDWNKKCQVERSYEYDEYKIVKCEPYGSTCLQRSRIFKIEG